MKKYMMNHKLLCFSVIATSILGSLGYVWIAILLQQLLDIVMAQHIERFFHMIVFSIGYFLVLGVLLYLQSLLEKKLINIILYEVRRDTFRGIRNHSLQIFSKSNSADYISSMTNDIKLLEDQFLLPLFEVIQYSVIFCASFIVMIYFDLIVTICVIFAILLMFVVPSLIGGVLEKRQQYLSQQLSKFTVCLKDIFSGFELMKSYSLEKQMMERFETSNKATKKAKLSVDHMIALNEGISAFLSLIVQVVVLFLSAYFILTGRITVGSLLGMVQVSSNMANPLLMIFVNVPKVKSVEPIIKKLKLLSLYSKNEIQNKNSAMFRQGIAMKHVSFSYDGEHDVLHDINCNIDKGKKYVIVGKSGCGKTTLIQLLSGYYDMYDGDILYDGCELRTVNEDEIVKLSSIVHQNVFMFDETIYDNICLYEKFPKEMVDQAVEDSGLSDFLSERSVGLSYQVGENGANLSGGQRQRIAVARALIRNKPILILDEGTSAMDMQTAHDIEQRLLKVRDLTLITITHKLDEELLRQYDCVLYMDNGRIKGMDHYDQLLKSSKEFAEFTSMIV